MEKVVKKETFVKTRAALLDERRRLKILRDNGLLDPDYPRGHFACVVETLSQIFEDMSVAFVLFGTESVWTLASTASLEAHSRVKRRDSIWMNLFPVISDTSTAVILDASNDERFAGHHFVTASPHIRFMCLSPVYFQDVVIGGICLCSPAPRGSFSMTQVEIVSSFCRIVTEIITSEAKQRQRIESMYLTALRSWPRNLSKSCAHLVESFQRVDGTIYKLLSLIPTSEDAKSMSDATMDNLSRSLGELNVKVDVVSSIGGLLQELMGHSGTNEFGETLPGSKQLTLAQLLENIDMAVATFGCEENFNLTVDQTAESLGTISTYSDSIIAIFRCMFSFFDQSAVVLNTLCVALAEQTDFNSAMHSEIANVAGQLCFEFVVNGTYEWSPSFGSLWQDDVSAPCAGGLEADCPTAFAEQFEWLRGIIVRLGGGMTLPTNSDEDKEKYKSCMSVSIWFPCHFEKKDLIASKEILLTSAPMLPFVESPISPLGEESNFSFVPSDLIEKESSEPPPHHAVLVIDDSILVQKMFKKIFSSLGIECEVASNGISGLELMKTRHFDIVFVDFIMPEQGGVSTIQMFSEWRMNSLYSGMFITDAEAVDTGDFSSIDDPLLIVGMSGTYDAPAVQEGFRNGVRVFLMKPVSKAKCKQIYDAKIGGQLNSEYAGKKLSDLPANETI